MKFPFLLNLIKAQDKDAIPKMPRAAKYAWGFVMTILLMASLTLEKGSLMMPLVNQAIDLLQQQQQQQQQR
jgi:hypothetical protein